MPMTHIQVWAIPHASSSAPSGKGGFGPGETQVALGNYFLPEYIWHHGPPQASLGVFEFIMNLQASLSIFERSPGVPGCL